MNILIVLLFFIPGLITEYVYETFSGQNAIAQRTSTFYKVLRSIAFNIPITAFTWWVIWFWKVVLGFDEMIESLDEFWFKCINEPFILKYCVVLLVGIILLSALFRIVSTLRSRKK